jgi:hypothetical protein
MRILIEICLTICEWIQEKNIQRAARKAAAECERKTIWTYLSQGAAGGMVGCFLMSAVSAVFYPAGYYSFLYLVVLPLQLAFGAILGSIIGGFVWLPAKLLKRRPGFVARSAIVLGITSLLNVAVSYWISESTGEPGRQWSLLLIGLVCALALPMVLLTGSRIRPGHLLFLGAGPRSKRHNFGSWLAFPAGALLRVASILALSESVLVLVICISELRSEWFRPIVREHLPEVVLAVVYFATSAYFSIRTPTKFVLLPAAVLLNIPLAFLLVNQQHSDTPYSAYLVYSFAGFIGLWAVYALGRLIAPEPSSPVFKSLPANVHVHQAMVAGKCHV